MDSDQVEREKTLLEKLTQRHVIVPVMLVVGLLVIAILGGGDTVQSVGVVSAGVILYFLPSIIARERSNSRTVFVINLFLGWTLIGWVVALAMAVSKPRPAPVIPQQSTAPSVESTKTCPFCAEDIKPEAVVCKHCGRDLPDSDQ